MIEDYKFMGLTPEASDEEIESTYEYLKSKFSRDRFLEGDEGNTAAKNLTKLENAYSQIKAERSFNSQNKFDDKGGISEIESLIKSGDLNKAQELLDSVTDRNAEWHYLQSVIFYKKKWTNESKKQLEIALKMDPGNKKYIDNYKKLVDNLAFKEKQFHSGNGYERAENVRPEPQMGGDACSSFAECCACNLCLNCMCNGCCR